jgi:hypothetical protein
MKKKIALLGNMNNNMFCLARYLRDLGYEADLFLIETSIIDHFKPINDSYENNFTEFVFETKWFENRKKERVKEVKKTLEKYDLVIGSGYAPALLNEINKPLDIFYPYGSDLYDIPKIHLQCSVFKKSIFGISNKVETLFYRIPSRINKPFRKYLDRYLNNANNLYISTQQYFGIKNTRLVVLPQTNTQFEKAFSKIETKAKRMYASLPFIYFPMYKKNYFEKAVQNSRYYKEFKTIRNTHKLVVFHHARQQWKTSPDQFSWKGNDVLIRGFADFIHSNVQPSACIIMLEYGCDVLESKILIKQLGIEANVFWLPVMARKELMIGLAISDIGCSEFSVSWAVGGTIFETLCLGIPLFHFMDKNLYKTESIFPHVNIKNSEDITFHLKKFTSNPEEYKVLGEEGREWFIKNAVESPLLQLEKEMQLLL